MDRSEPYFADDLPTERLTWPRWPWGTVGPLHLELQERESPRQRQAPTLVGGRRSDTAENGRDEEVY